MILLTVMMEGTHISETSVLTRTTQSHILEYGIFHSDRCENLISYTALTGWAL
jgi:hypothetical protein